MSEEKELPRYKCHKEVWALKIDSLQINRDGSATIFPREPTYSSFNTKPGWDERFKGSEEDTGYYVLYKDGYESWSPTDAFEDGYTLVE